MTELTTARAEVEAAATADATRVVTAELEALCGSSISSSVAANGGTNDELKLAREAALEQVTQWAAVHPQGRGGGSPDRCGRAGDALGGGTRGGRAPDGSGSPDRHGHAAGWDDGDHGIYRRCGSPSPDRYHDHRGIQAVVRDVGPDVG
jgi:hypothetical protein